MESNITRDHLAMEAMKIYSVTTCFIHNPKNISETSYEMADAMIVERERKEQ